MTKVYLDNFNEDSKKPCWDCSAIGEDYRGQIPFPLCKLAQLENDLKRIPTVAEVVNAGTKIGSIPEGCPNGYGQFASKEIR